VSVDRETMIVRARLRKAVALAAVLAAHGATGSDVSSLPDEARRTVEELAGVRESSDETWSMAADLVAARRALDAAGVDPFEGL
jgi:hypothetical protein